MYKSDTAFRSGDLRRSSWVWLAAASALWVSVTSAAEFRGFAPRVTLSVLHKAHSVVADDMNGDGHLDLVVAVAAANSVAVFNGKGDGTFAAATYWPVGTMPKFAATGDFNRDGHRDIVTADQDSRTISILLGNGDGTFRPKVSYPACNGPHEVAVADFNGDGIDDVVVACHTKPNFASVFLGRGDGTFLPRRDVQAGAEPTSVVVSDFNHDGIPDLAFANRAANTVSVLIGIGDGTFREAAAYPTGQSPHAVRAADLNGDGVVDLVTANDYGKSVSVLLGIAAGGFRAPLTMPVVSLPKSIALADLNGDGIPDIVVTNTTYPSCCTLEGSTLSVFINRGDGTFETRRDYYVGGNPFSLLVRDLAGDGRLEVVTANYLDMNLAQQNYLRATRALHLGSRMGKVVGLALIVLVSLGVAAFSWRRYRWMGAIGTLVLALLLAAGLYYCTYLRYDSESHIALLKVL